MTRAIRLTLAVLALLPWSADPADARPRDGFHLTYLAVWGRRIDSIAYDFTGDGRPDVLNTSIDFDASPPVRWFALHVQNRDGGYAEKPDQIWSVDRRACGLLFGDFLPPAGIEIGFVAPDGVYVYPREKDRTAEDPVKLLHLRTYFTTPSDRTLPVWQWVTDLDNDGRHDLLLPTPDGYTVCFQTAPGTFGRICRLEADLKREAPRALAVRRSAVVSDMISALFTLNAQLPKLTAVDIDGDALLDLATIDGSTLTIFFQREARAFASVPKWRYAFKVVTLEEEVKKDVVHLSSVAFTDINGDKNADLVVTQTYGEVGLFESIKTTIYVHYGNGKGLFVAANQIRIDGVSLEPEFVDLNGDGTLECMTSRLRTDVLGQAAKGFLLGDVSITYEVFQFDKASNGYRSDPVYSYDVRVTFDDMQKKGAASRPMMYFRGDFSGDGRPDQVRTNPKTEELEFHQGRDSARGTADFTPTPWDTYKPERTPKGIVIYDVNGDGRSDVMMLHSGQVGLLLSKPRR